mmetsp:Transcript_69863/g.195339  ORF Transcript_69863/g.195339 Transcript_69863/m.195339 type:complete len:148 (-) Transcript_69863:3216-3659(-)
MGRVRREQKKKTQQRLIGDKGSGNSIQSSTSFSSLNSQTSFKQLQAKQVNTKVGLFQKPAASAPSSYATLRSRTNGYGPGGKRLDMSKEKLGHMLGAAPGKLDSYLSSQSHAFSPGALTGMPKDLLGTVTGNARKMSDNLGDLGKGF